jgi:peptidoglycan/xylan/chitin deacetylase (PgdA/CDA1 family)
LLDALAERGVRSTWFLQGRWVEAHPATARRVAADGHLVGNHSFYHARLPLLTAAGIRTDVRSAERVIREVVGVDPRPWFRCPFSAGSDDRRVLGILAGLGYRQIGEDVVLEDWEPHRTGRAMVADALRLVPAVGDPAVVLFHAWPPGTLDALPSLIDGLRERGATFVGIDELAAKAA